ncbi:MAG: DUF3850 domain-containing protein [Hafnia sp.]
MKTHELKILPEYFESVISGKKKAELRRNDRYFSAGDKLLLKEWSLEHEYSGRSVGCIITDVADVSSLAKGYVLLSIERSVLPNSPDADHIECWYCNKVVTYKQLAEADGFCPFCYAEIELQLKPADK